MRAIAVSLLLFLTSICSWAAPANEKKQAAALVSVSYSDDMSMATLTIANNSSKTITAFSMSIDEEYMDGQKGHMDRAEDFVGALLVSGHFLRQGLGPISPHTNRDTVLYLDKDRVKAIKVSVNAVIYADLTGEGDETRLQMITNMRQSRADGVNAGLKILSTALADPAIPDPLDMAHNQLTQAVQAESVSEKQAALEGLINEIEYGLRKQWDRMQMQDYLEHLAQEAGHYSKHAQITRII